MNPEDFQNLIFNTINKKKVILNDSISMIFYTILFNTYKFFSKRMTLLILLTSHMKH